MTEGHQEGVDVDTRTPQGRLRRAVEGFGEEARTKLSNWLGARTPAAFRAMELEVAALARGVADQVVAVILEAITDDADFQAQCSAAVRAATEGGLRHAERRSVEITLLGGTRVKVRTAYFKRDRRGRPGRRRGPGRRGKTGSGLFPVLAAVGIWFGVTPALADEITRQVADSDSVRAGRAALARRNIDLGHKQVLRIVNAFGRRAVQQREEWLADVLTGPVKSGVARGKRVVVCADGGRVRERVELPGRPRAETGHHRYEAPWREPKLFTIYVIDKEGNIDETFRPIYDGTMENCDGAFVRLTAYLKALGVHEASTLVVLGDGARWIWERIDQLVSIVGIPKERVVEIVDWYHAVEKLGEVADERASWPAGERRLWLARAKDNLYAGDISGLMRAFDEIAIGRRAGAVNAHRDYFVGNAHRMRYSEFSKAKIPIGSGAVESAVRRVINMRIKGAGTFWLRENVEAMILLRSYLKAGRFDDLVDWSLGAAAAWWQPAKSPRAPLKEAA